MQLEIPCKICKKPLKMTLPDDLDEESLRMLLPMVAHDRCHDLSTRKTRALEQISKVAQTWINTRLEPQPRNIAQIRDSLRETLREVTQKLCYIDADYLGHPGELVWTPEVVDRLMQDPGNWDKIVTEMRKRVTTHFRKAHPAYQI
jgi:hypothetical protein